MLKRTSPSIMLQRKMVASNRIPYILSDARLIASRIPDISSAFLRAPKTFPFHVL